MDVQVAAEGCTTLGSAPDSHRPGCSLSMAGKDRGDRQQKTPETSPGGVIGSAPQAEDPPLGVISRGWRRFTANPIAGRDPSHSPRPVGGSQPGWDLSGD